MDYETVLKTCSEEVQAAINWLEEKVRFDKRKLENRLKKEKNRDWIKDISRRLKVKYLCGDALDFYVLSKVNSPLLKEFLDAAERSFGLMKRALRCLMWIFFMTRIFYGTYQRWV